MGEQLEGISLLAALENALRAARHQAQKCIIMDVATIPPLPHMLKSGIWGCPSYFKGNGGGGPIHPPAVNFQGLRINEGQF